MLQLKDIVKTYHTGDTEVQALKGVSINFRPNEFVSILGQSGCGKTTLLNIIGGLDQYTSGDLVIKGKSTKQYKDKDWDAYRNHSIGFVFQSYNLIMHQSVLQNVELALTLSGVSKSERRRRAKEVLEKVGLGNQLNKKPNQMSGGQMQRVAIARALINDPEILLADEPTGALDTETSVQIMDLLKEIAEDRLVIMVTHNPELAEKYSTRIVRLLDGEVIDDSDPYSDEEIAKEKYEELDHKSLKHKRMSYFTALNLSFNNLLTKKGRTILTAFAGSIGIIGIALILSLSDGFRNYIKGVEEDTLSTYPLEITDESVDSSAMMTMMMGNVERSEDAHEMDKIYSNDFVGNYINTLMGEVKVNDMISFKDYIEEGDGKKIKDYTTDIMYNYGINVNAYQVQDNDEIFQSNPCTVLDSIGMGTFSEISSMSVGTSSMSMNLWSQMIDNQEMLENQYDVIAGKWPENYNEIVIVVSEYNEITDYELYSLGLRDVAELQEMVTASIMGGTKKFDSTSYTYDEILNLRYMVIPSCDFYAYDEASKCWVDKSDDAEYMLDKIKNGVEVKVSAIVRPSDRATVHSITTTVGYRKDLVEHLMEQAKQSEVGKEQLENPDINVFTGYEFGTDLSEVAEEEAEQSSQEMLGSMGLGGDMSNEEMAAAMANMSEEELAAMMSAMEESTASIMQGVSLTDLKTVEDATYDENLVSLGIAFEEDPMIIRMYPVDFESKEAIMDIIDDYNKSVLDAGDDDKEITYTDMVGTMMSSISSIINSISYVLMAFVAISLVVSSIMIGIITYISVLERTKEIGVLRSIGASKKDISRVFNAETIIVGFVAGLLGIIVTILLNIPINKIIEHLSDLKDVAKLPVAGAVILIVISVVLTMIAGLLPSRVASKKDPVEALRSE
ncbi:MAG: ABC transporter ATP-binding protein/permease [Clostridium sp.]|nr:ABC transporter ATP-binding protein/permease [Clostridium sp.]MCM1400298.1 ABC transporter ATP-binding protein/permease [Clostridium sp.]MCM1461023.1 ABC transporter ATP-binding protein/permease [Bacteroides sp.]